MSRRETKWKEIQIDNWLAYEKEIAENIPRNWIYRGHRSVDYKLESSFYRTFHDIQAIIKLYKGSRRRFDRDEYEEELISLFRSHAHLYLPTVPKEHEENKEKLEWLSIMQHHGTPTRLLDFTFSPYIAAYFALEKGQDDCCVYALKHQYFTEIDEEHFKGTGYKTKVFEDQRGEKSFFFPYEPKMRNERLVCQQGLFLVPSTNYMTIDDLLLNYSIDVEVCIKYILSRSMRYEGLRKLRMMNISAATLFPGIDGFCRSLRFQILETSRRLKRLC